MTWRYMKETKVAQLQIMHEKNWLLMAHIPFPILEQQQMRMNCAWTDNLPYYPHSIMLEILVPQEAFPYQSSELVLWSKVHFCQNG